MRKAGLVLPVVSWAMLIGACNSGDVEPLPEAVDQALATSYGGEVTTDEQPAFGDPVLAGVTFQTEDVAVADRTVDRPELAGARTVNIALAWGYLRPHPEATTAVDWSGSITVDNAAVRVLRTLRFEDRTDVVIRPRTDIYSVAFTSQTLPHADGLLLSVVLAPSLNPNLEPVTLTFNSAPFTTTLTLEAGMRMNHVEVVDEAGHVFSYQIIRPDADGCSEGFLRGRWQGAGEVEGRVLGRMHGRFFSADGRVVGFMRGVFGQRENGKQVWFAKVIGADGRFRGLIVGRFGEGKFAGLILVRGDGDAKLIEGAVRGHYFDGEAEGSAGGFMGRWSQRCGEDPREGAPSDTDEPEVALDLE